MTHIFSDYPRIMVDSEVCFGKPCIVGTRMPVTSVLSYISGGMSVEDLLKEFSWLKREDVLQAIAFAAGSIDNRIIPLKKAS
ncbi:MAG: DUF433 domain-containing protein [Bacteroidia bacterium]